MNRAPGRPAAKTLAANPGGRLSWRGDCSRPVRSWLATVRGTGRSGPSGALLAGAVVGAVVGAFVGAFVGAVVGAVVGFAGAVALGIDVGADVGGGVAAGGRA